MVEPTSYSTLIDVVQVGGGLGGAQKATFKAISRCGTNGKVAASRVVVEWMLLAECLSASRRV